MRSIIIKQKEELKKEVKKLNKDCVKHCVEIIEKI